MKIKIITLFSICIAAFFSSNAQIRLDPFYPYSNWTVGVGAGYSQIYGNLDHTNSEPVIRLDVQRNANPWVCLDFELQRGALSDYESKNHWTNGLSVYNTFTGFDVNGRISLGEFFNAPSSFLAKTIFGLYVGIGIGYMQNNVSDITLKFKSSDKLTITDYNTSNIETNSSNFYLPFIAGFNLHLTRRCMFNINYEFSYAFSDYLDGYNFQKPTANNNYNDMFSVLSFGLHFYVGHIGTGRRNGTYRTRHN